jgi:type III secretory pathway component EscU
MSGEHETNFGGKQNPLLPSSQISVAAEVDGDKGKEKPESASIDVSKLQVEIFIFYFLLFTRILFSQIQHSIKELIGEIRSEHKEAMKEMRQENKLMTWVGICLTIAVAILTAVIFIHGILTDGKKN